MVSQQAAPAELTAGGDPDFKLLGEIATQLIEVAQPRYKLLASLNYNTGRFGFIGRMTHFGEVQAASGGLSLEDPNVIESDSGDRLVQVFSDKALVDLSISFRFSDNFTWSIGSNNIFDTYPDKWNNTRDGAIGQASNYSSGQIPYSRNSNQFGFNGAYYYTSFNINF